MMKIDLPSLITAVKLTILTPRTVARQIIALQLDKSVGLLGCGLAIVVSALLSSVAARIPPQEMSPEIAVLFANPFQLAVVQAIILLVSLMLIHGIGRAFGGRGAFREALALMAWLEGVLVLVQLAQLALMLFAPGLAVVLGLLTFVVFLWTLASFVAELHGFASTGKVLGSIFLGFFLLSFVMALLGVGAPVTGAGNV